MTLSTATPKAVFCYVESLGVESKGRGSNYVQTATID